MTLLIILVSLVLINTLVIVGILLWIKQSTQALNREVHDSLLKFNDLLLNYVDLATKMGVAQGTIVGEAKQKAKQKRIDAGAITDGSTQEIQGIVTGVIKPMEPAKKAASKKAAPKKAE